MSRIEELLLELQMECEINFMRSDFTINMEPDLFHRFSIELMSKHGIRKEQRVLQDPGDCIKIAGPAGYIVIKQDKSLGSQFTHQIYGDD